MADRYWIASSAGNWNDTANWSTTSGGSGGASVPGSSDTAYFDGNGTGDCTVNVNINVTGINLVKEYTGTFDGSSYDVTIGTGGFDWDIGYTGNPAGGTLDLGSGDWTCSGNFGWGRLTDQLVDSGHTLTLTGTGKTFDPWFAGGESLFRTVTIDTGATITWPASYNCEVNDLLHVKGTLTLGSSYTENKLTAGVNSGTYDRDLTIDTGGEVAGSNTLEHRWYNGVGDFVNNGTISCAKVIFIGYKNPGSDFDFGTITSDEVYFNEFAQTQIPIAAGTYDLPGNIFINLPNGSSAWNYNGSAKEVNINYGGDVTVTALGNYTKGTGTITFNGDDTQEIDFNGEATEDWDIDTTGTVQLTGAVDPDNITITDGTLDVNGNNVSSGQLTMAAGTSLID